MFGHIGQRECPADIPRELKYVSGRIKLKVLLLNLIIPLLVVLSSLHIFCVCIRMKTRRHIRGFLTPKTEREEAQQLISNADYFFSASSSTGAGAPAVWSMRALDDPPPPPIPLASGARLPQFFNRQPPTTPFPNPSFFSE
ncbi:hypothetical protein CHARACLAT_028598 [Characodon lateralis]|uniref:Uncharacterized protein n=1 Tax=Characodon lateralis TaxID=208331 RepID=A0ABU7DL40_9TELE|nr:hypothetical protein [Characodon lateralis]